MLQLSMVPPQAKGSLQLGSAGKCLTGRRLPMGFIVPGIRRALASPTEVPSAYISKGSSGSF